MVVEKELCLHFARGRRAGAAKIHNFKNVRGQVVLFIIVPIEILIQSSSDLSVTPVHAQMAEVCVSASVWKWTHY